MGVSNAIHPRFLGEKLQDFTALPRWFGVATHFPLYACMLYRSPPCKLAPVRGRVFICEMQCAIVSAEDSIPLLAIAISCAEFCRVGVILRQSRCQVGEDQRQQGHSLDQVQDPMLQGELRAIASGQLKVARLALYR